MWRLKRKKAMNDFYKQHSAFLNWYLEKQCNISEKLYHLVIRHFVECLNRDLEILMSLNELEQRKWIISQINSFLENENDSWGGRHV